MKKKILGGIAVIAIATVVALNMQITVGENDQITDLSMANVEALAQYENDELDGNIYLSCFSVVSYANLWELGVSVFYCGSCKMAWVQYASSSYQCSLL